MGLHRNVGVEVIQGAIGFFAALIATLVHALDFFGAATGSFVLMSTREGPALIDL